MHLYHPALYYSAQQLRPRVVDETSLQDVLPEGLPILREKALTDNLNEIIGHLPCNSNQMAQKMFNSTAIHQLLNRRENISFFPFLTLQFLIDQKLKMDFDLSYLRGIFENASQLCLVDGLHEVHFLLHLAPQGQLILFELGSRGVFFAEVVLADFVWVQSDEQFQFVLVDPAGQGGQQDAEIYCEDAFPEFQPKGLVHVPFLFAGDFLLVDDGTTC